LASRIRAIRVSRRCNSSGRGADRAAANLARLGRTVKKMIGGIEGWKDEGFDLATG
jgi:rhodanese-related sulfurtransferase